MSKLIEKTDGGKLRATDALVKAVEAEFKNSPKLPDVVKAIDAKTGAKTLHVVAPIVWKLEAAALGSLDPKPASIVAARKAGQRREVVAARSGLSVAKVREIETKGSRKPVYTGKGTKKHLAAA